MLKTSAVGPSFGGQIEKFHPVNVDFESGTVFHTQVTRCKQSSFYPGATLGNRSKLQQVILDLPS
jgi:hypothetical protein